jgi:hypothetical protein
VQFLSKNNKIMAKSDMDSVGTSFLRSIPAQQRLHKKSPSTSPPQQALHSNPSDRPQAASGLQLQRRLHIRPALAARSALTNAPSQPAAAGKASRTGLRGSHRHACRPEADVLMYYSRKCPFALPCHQPRSRQNQSQHPAPFAASTLKACCRTWPAR